MLPVNRRTFLKSTTTAAVAAGFGSTFSINVLGANEKIILGVMGIHGRGNYLAHRFLEREDVELKSFADPDTRLFADRVKEVEDKGFKAPDCVQDFRRMLEDKDVDAIVMGTPDHWHAPGTIFACQAGKHVYVEKPCHHNLHDGKQMIEAAKRYNRVVQIGHQNRSAPYIHQAIEYIQSGRIGDVHLVRVMNSKARVTIGNEPDGMVPEGVDYKMWLGPCKDRPFNNNHFHYAWHWFWEYSGGDIINDGVHQMDIARWVSGVTTPKSVYSTGGVHFFNDDQETPDTHVAVWDFDKLTMVFEQELWSPYMKKVPMPIRDGDNLPTWPFIGTRIEISGTKNFMYLGRHGGGWEVYDADGKPIARGKSGFSKMERDHIANFIDCIRTGKRPNCPVEEAHLSALLCQYANASYRLGRKLLIDPETLGFLHDDEANALTKRPYREPFGVPEVV